MRVLRNPVLQFLTVGLLALAALVAVGDRFAEDAAQEEALAEARAINGVLARSVVRPEVPASLIRLDAGAADQFDRQVQQRLELDEPRVTRVILWRNDGTILYSNQFDLFGQAFDLTPVQRRVLEGRARETRTLSEPAGQRNPDTGELAGPDPVEERQARANEEQVRIYTRIRHSSGERLLFEADYALSDIAPRREAIYESFRWLVFGVPLLLLLAVTPLLHVLTRRLTRAGEERERLLRSAIDASDAERRRIARDLHDGVVQDLAGTAYSMAALARSPQTAAPARETLEAANHALRDSLTSLRSLLAEIHPPDLRAAGLPAALADLIAPAEREGVQASLSVSGLDPDGAAGHADDAAVALVWRVAQEAVRNALRHADATTLAVTVRGLDDTLLLEVVDDGVGFDPTLPAPDERYGLRGMQSLVADTGGRLEIVSAPGEGTTVRLEVERR